MAITPLAHRTLDTPFDPEGCRKQSPEMLNSIHFYLYCAFYGRLSQAAFTEQQKSKHQTLKIAHKIKVTPLWGENPQTVVRINSQMGRHSGRSLAIEGSPCSAAWQGVMAARGDLSPNILRCIIQLYESDLGRIRNPFGCKFFSTLYELVR